MIIDSGAEAIIKKENDDVVKERITKDYRIKEVDEKLRKRRTRREAKVLDKLSQLGFPSPRLKDFCDRSMTIQMDHVNGSKLRDVLYKDPLGLGREIGRKVGTMHNNDIVHGDLTTSNMILDNEIKFIDFGLSMFSNKVEDKAVDLHLLDRALESKHYKIHKACMNFVIKGYKTTYKNHKEVLNRLEKVQARGRNKHK